MAKAGRGVAPGLGVLGLGVAGLGGGAGSPIWATPGSTPGMA